MKYRCIIFDCDGTLIDTLDDIAAAMNQSLAEHGFPAVPVPQYRDMVGWGLSRLAFLALPEPARADETVAAVAARAQQLMDQQPPEQCLSKPYPGVKEMITKLAEMKSSRSNRIYTAVLSNKPNSVLHRLMAHFFGQNAFDAICGLQHGVAPKPDPQSVWETLTEFGRNPHDTVFMGDSEIDMETARNSGCYPLGVSWGFRSRAVLEKSGAARIIDQPDQVWDILNRISI